MQQPNLPKTLWLSGVNGSVTFGDGVTQRGRYPAGRKSPSGAQEYPGFYNGGVNVVRGRAREKLKQNVKIVYNLQHFPA